MPRSLVKVYVDTKIGGPLFDGRASAAVRAWLDSSKKDVAQLVVDTLHEVAGKRFKHPTGHYMGEITRTNLSYNDIRISDPVIYGPWLEGTSKRNTSTRFKGYHLWRRARTKARREAIPITQRKLDEFIGRMGGEGL